MLYYSNLVVYLSNNLKQRNYEQHRKILQMDEKNK